MSYNPVGITMTTFTYTTTSTTPELTDQEAVAELVSEYCFTVQPTVVADQISFFANAKPDQPFDVYKTYEQQESAVEEFFTQLSEHLENALEVKCVQISGTGEPDAFKWTVDTQGNVEKLVL